MKLRGEFVDLFMNVANIQDLKAQVTDLSQRGCSSLKKSFNKPVIVLTYTVL